jgi:DNA-binding MarR family transcriptional regulator
MPSLSADLRQGKPFDSLQQEAFLSVARTAAVLQGELDPVLAQHDLSLNQYNVLRVLRGAGENGLCRNEIRDRLITRMPDASRLLERMEASGLIRRVRSTADRRLVNTTLTEAGLRLVSELDAEVAQVHARQFAHLTPSQLRTLVELLSQTRDRP